LQLCVNQNRAKLSFAQGAEKTERRKAESFSFLFRYSCSLAGTRGFVDCSDDLHVSTSEFAGNRRVASRQNAVSEIIDLGRLLIYG
jgi:hypothetical protein